jgi:hypothetical protein
MRQTEFVDQLEYMPILSSRASSSAPAKSRSSTVAPGETSENEEAMSGDFVLLREPSKMQKNHITACFTHWMARQEEGKIGFEFANVLDSREGALRPAVRLHELSDLGETESDAPPPPPRNPPKRKRQKKKAKIMPHHSDTDTVPPAKEKKRKRPTKAVQKPPTPHPQLPAGLLALEWDPMVDPALRPEAVQPHRDGPTGGRLFAVPLESMTAGGPPAVYDAADATQAAYLAEVERGHALMNGPVPAWIQNVGTPTLDDIPLQPALRHRAQSDIYTQNEFSATTAEPLPTSGGSRSSPVPDSSRRWIRTRSTSRPRRPVEKSQTDTAAVNTPGEGNSKAGTNLKKSIESSDRPKPKPKVKGRKGSQSGGGAGVESDIDSFDLHNRHVP